MVPCSPPGWSAGGEHEGASDVEAGRLQQFHPDLTTIVDIAENLPVELDTL
jgi:hypothetical protein